MPEIQINKNISTSKFLIALGVVLVMGMGINFLLIRPLGLKSQSHTDKIAGAIIQPVSAQEIYPMFICPCCGKPLDPKNICCGMAQERITFIDGLTAGKMFKEEIIMAYVKKYGLNSFADKNQAEEFKKKLIAQAPADRPTISVSPESIDLGDVSQTKGEISTLFEITNTGKTDLIINKLDTSCDCTSAAIVFNGEEGPRFAMAGHGVKSPTDWSVTIPSGEKAQLKVYYDPNVHKDFRGAAIREIYIFSNDPINFETKVKIELNQVD